MNLFVLYSAMSATGYFYNLVHNSSILLCTKKNMLNIIYFFYIFKHFYCTVFKNCYNADLLCFLSSPVCLFVRFPIVIALLLWTVCPCFEYFLSKRQGKKFSSTNQCFFYLCKIEMFIPGQNQGSLI